MWWVKMKKLDKKDSIICFMIDSDTKNAIEEYVYASGRWESVSEFIRWLLKAYFKRLREYQYVK